MRWRAALGVPTVLLLSACAGTTAQVAADSAVHDTGTVRGTYEMEGGPVRPGGSQPPVQPLAGVVIFQGRGAKIRTRVGQAGQFSVRLPAGSYTVSGRSPSIREQRPDGHFVEGRCSSPLRVTVHSGKSQRITVMCIVP